MFDSNSNTYAVLDEANDSLLEDLQLPSIWDLLAETITSETNIDLYSSDTETVTLAQSSDSLELESAELSKLGNNSNDDPRRGRNTVTDLSAIAILPTANAGFTGNSYLDGILGSNYGNTGRETDDEEKLKQALENHLPIQEVSFNPLTGEEEVISWEQQPENLQLLDEYLASAGFDGIDGLLASLGSPTEFGKQFNSIATNENNSFNEIVFDNSINPESVFGVDNRTQITNTTDYPWSSIARIEVEFSNGSGAIGSGAMISPYHILTAGHVVHNASAGGWATDIDVFLAQDGSEQFYGEADWTYIRSYTGWTNSQSQDHDWALITLDRNIGNFTGWLGYEWRSNDADYNGLILNTAGYPGDLSFNAQDMYFASGPVAFADTHQLYYNGTMDTFGGQSGSPVWRYNSSTGDRHINAVHAYGNGGNGYNEGTRITQTKFNSLQNWISEDDGVRSPIDRSDLVDYDDWFDTNFAYFSSSTVTPGDNITLRSVTRNNGTATAGNFDVSFYASTNSIISTGDYFIGKVNISSLDAFGWTDTIWTGNFPNIPAGNYYVGWLIDSGNSQTEFLEGNNTGVISDSLLTVSDLPSTGDILGTVWDDVDGDGVFETGEVGLSGWTVYLDQNQNGQLDLGETSTITDNNGDYSFIGLLPDTYYVAEVVQNGWEQTHPNISNLNSLQIDPIQITTTDSNIPITTYGEIIATSDEIPVVPESNVSGPLINIDDFRADPRFNGIDGNGFATVILDTGIDLNHPFFGPDSDNNGIADRIVYQYDFADNDSDASDVDGHGSNVSSIVASSDSTYTGVAPGADIIHLKVFEDSGSGNFSYIEQALKWVVANAATYNIASVNMSLGDSGNYSTSQSLYGIGDELAALAAMDVMVVSASGNDFYSFGSALGVAYPSADPNSLSIGAVYDANIGSFISYSSGATAYYTGADRITPFSQRHNDLTTIVAPGAAITGAGPNGGTVTQHGTSQASPHVSGVAVLAQQLAQQTLGRSLTLTEFSNLLASSGVTINDGDDENDNVTNSNLNFQRLDVLALGEAILAMGSNTVNLSAGDTVSDIDFGNQQTDTQGTPSNDVLSGTPNNDRIDGLAGNDTIDGGAGSDSMIGGTDDDTFIVDNVGDVVTENPGEGIDRVRSSISYTLGLNVEHLTLIGSKDLNGTGNNLNNNITGNNVDNLLDGGAGKDRINGRGGDDTIIGGNGRDILTGGGGSDRFVYTDLTDSLRTGYDKVKDFNANGTDLFITSVARADFVNAGAVASLSNRDISTALNSAGFNADFAAFFTFGTREFIAINDSNSNFQQATDAIIEVTGFTGTLALEDFSVM